MSNKLIDEIKSIIDKNKDNAVGMDIDVLSKTFSIKILNDLEDEIDIIYDIDLNELFNKIFDNDLKLDWY